MFKSQTAARPAKGQAGSLAEMKKGSRKDCLGWAQLGSGPSVKKLPGGQF